MDQAKHKDRNLSEQTPLRQILCIRGYSRFQAPSCCLTCFRSEFFVSWEPSKAGSERCPGSLGLLTGLYIWGVPKME